MPNKSKKYLFILLFTMLYSQNCIAQNQQKVLNRAISVSKKSESIRNYIKYTAVKYNISYTYRSDMPDLNIRKSIDCENMSLKDFLTQLFRNTNMNYICYNEQIILTQKNKVSAVKTMKGQVLDAESKLPIPYAGILILPTEEAVIADYSGRFELQYNSRAKDSIRIAALGYNSRTVSPQKYSKSVNPIFLKRKTYPLENINIKATDYFTKKSGNAGLIAFGSVYIDTHGQQAALFIENPESARGKVKSVSFKLSGKGNISAPFRLRIYAADSTGYKPGKDLMHDVIILRPQNAGWFTAEISQYRITAPAEGFFVAIQGVYPPDFESRYQENEFTELNKEPELKDLIYGQMLAYNLKRKNKTWHYSLSHRWFQTDKNRFNIMIKAKIRYNKLNIK